MYEYSFFDREQLALNLRLEGTVAQRCAHLARGSNITRDIDVSKRGDNVGRILINLSVIHFRKYNRVWPH